MQSGPPDASQKPSLWALPVCWFPASAPDRYTGATEVANENPRIDVECKVTQLLKIIWDADLEVEVWVIVNNVNGNVFENRGENYSGGTCFVSFFGGDASTWNSVGAGSCQGGLPIMALFFEFWTAQGQQFTSWSCPFKMVYVSFSRFIVWNLRDSMIWLISPKNLLPILVILVASVLKATGGWFSPGRQVETDDSNLMGSIRQHYSWRRGLA